MSKQINIKTTKTKTEDQTENVCNSVKRLQRKAAYYGLLPNTTYFEQYFLL